ncbi:hypothetical protein DNTS_034611, partial [Danionella cerebrum]
MAKLTSSLGQIMLYVDGMNGLIAHNDTVQWLYSLVGSKFRLVVKTALKLLLVFVEYTESNAALLIQAVNTVENKHGCKSWSNAMEILDEKDGMDTELLVYAMTLINKTLSALPDQDSFYDLVDSLEEQGMEGVSHRHLSRKGTDLDLVEQFNIYEATLRHEDGDDEARSPPCGHKSRRRASLGATPERRGLERRRSRRHSLQSGRGHTSAPTSPCHSHTSSSRNIQDITEREEEDEEENEEFNRQESGSWMAPTAEEASSLCLPLNCMVHFIPNTADSESEGKLMNRSGIRVVRRAPLSSSPVTPDFSPPISTCLSSWASVRSLGAIPSRGSSITSSASTSPSDESLSPVLPSLLSARPPSCPGNSDEVFVIALQGPDSDTSCSKNCAGSCPGRLSGVSSPPATSNSHVASTSPFTESKPDRPALGGLLSSSHRQHQESLNAERERRRLEREERLQRIEREERNRFSRDYADKREEVRLAREERYKQVERLAAEEKERDRPRPRGRTEITLSLSSRPSSSSSSRSVTPLTMEVQEDVRSIPRPAQGATPKEMEQPSLVPSTASVSTLVKVQEPGSPSDIALSLSAAVTESENLAVEQKPMNPEEDEQKEVFEERSEETESNLEMIVMPSEESRGGDRMDAEESSVLSEKERQNEELNEKDNCSASSISSASSTLEREERERDERCPSDTDSGQWKEFINKPEAIDQCSKVLNSKLFMLDRIYTKNEDEGEKEKEKVCLGQDPSLSTLASLISTLEARRQASEDAMKKIDLGHFDNQGNVRAVAEKFGDLVKVISPHEVEVSGKEKQQALEKPPPAPSPTPPKKESEHIWEQLMAVTRELRIKELDFTDLREEDDLDILDVGSMIGSGDLTPPVPPHCLPPPPPLFGCPPPPPFPGTVMPPPPPMLTSVPPAHPGSPVLGRGEALLFQKKKKTIRLFWNEVRPIDWQHPTNRKCRESLWSKLDPVKLDTAKLENLFETKSKELPVTKKTAADGKRQEIIVLDSKRSNAINIGLTVLPPPRTIKTAILNFDEYALSKEGIEKILTMVPTEEETQKIQEAQLANPETPLGSAEQFLLILSSISELSARLQLWAFKMDYETLEKEVAEPLQDLKEGMEQLEKNKTLGFILSTLLAIGNFLNGTNAKGFELSYLEKVPEVKDTVHKQSLLHHVCSMVVEKFPESSDLYSEIGAVTRSAK